MINRSRCREKNGVIGRWHTYHCRACGNKFSVFLLRPLPDGARICLVCRAEDSRLESRVQKSFEERR